jgi:hypothetical protein
MQATEKESEITLKVPRWFVKLLMLSTKNQPHNQRVFFELLKPMTPEVWKFQLLERETLMGI